MADKVNHDVNNGKVPVAKRDQTFDPVHKPKHYNSHPSGIETIQVTEHFNFCLGNAIKYIWRADLKNGRILRRPFGTYSVKSLGAHQVKTKKFRPERVTIG